MVKYVNADTFSAQMATHVTVTKVKKYSKLKIIRALGDEWKTYKEQLETAGYADQFWAAEYISSDDPVFQTFIALIPESVRTKLEECLWDEESSSIKTFVMAATLLCLFGLTGCFSPTSNIIREYDSEGKLLRETETSESVVKTLTDSTKNKTVIFWDNSFLAYISASTVTADSPTPALKMGIGKADKGMISLLDKHGISAVSGIIQTARDGDLSISASGVSAKQKE